MANVPAFQAPPAGGPPKWALICAAILLLAVAIWFAYRMLTDIQGVAVKSASPTVVDMLPPPPPPPPPPQEKPPEPVEKTEPEPAPQPDTPDKPAPAPMQIDGPAQAGGDAYGMQAGSGNGIGAPAANGACTGPACGAVGIDRFWGRNIANALEDYIDGTRTVNVDSFVSEFDIWVSTGGTLTQARLVKSTGNAKLDQTLLALLEKARGLKPPPASIRMPQRIKIGRKRI